MSQEFWAVAAPIVTAVTVGLLLKLGDWFLGRGKDRREVRKDLREEVTELWERIDNLEERLAKKEEEIVVLRGQLTDLPHFKQRYQETLLENAELRKQVAELDKLRDKVAAQQQHIERLEAELAQLKQRRRQP